MKKILIILTGLLSVVSASDANTCEIDACTCKRPPCSKRLFYLQLGGAGVALDKHPETSVAIGLGWRYIGGTSGVDISFMFMPARGGAYNYNLPRLRYLYFVHPRVYLGAGLSYSEVRNTKHTEFGGIAGEFAIGYDIPTDGWARAFIELAVSQPAIPTRSLTSILGPTVSLTFGVGL